MWMGRATEKDEKKFKEDLKKEIKLGPVGEFLGIFGESIFNGVVGALKSTPTILGAIIGIPSSEEKFEQMLYGPGGLGESIVKNLEANEEVLRDPDLLYDALSDMSEEDIAKVMGESAGKTFLIVAPLAKRGSPSSRAPNAKGTVGKITAEKINVGGTGEAPGYTNLNPVKSHTGGRQFGIQELIQQPFEKIAEFIKPNSASKIISNRLRFVDVTDWTAAAKGAYEVMKPGGKLSMNIWASAEQARLLAKAFTKAGFKEVKISGEGVGTMLTGTK
jgi:hypothetical protein